VGCPLRRTTSAGHRRTVANPETSLSSRWPGLQSLLPANLAPYGLSAPALTFRRSSRSSCPRARSDALKHQSHPLLPFASRSECSCRGLPPYLPQRDCWNRDVPRSYPLGVSTSGASHLTSDPDLLRVDSGWHGHPRPVGLAAIRCFGISLAEAAVTPRFARQHTWARRFSAAFPLLRSARKPDPARAWSRIDPCRSPRGAGTSPSPGRLQAPIRRPTPKRRAVHALTGSLPVHAGPSLATPSRRSRRMPCQARRSSLRHDVSPHRVGDLPIAISRSRSVERDLAIARSSGAAPRDPGVTPRKPRGCPEPSSRRTGRLADSKAHRSVFALVKPSNDADGGRLPWGFGPFGAYGFGQRLIPGLPPPATRRPRVFSTPRRIAPPVTCPALFHAGNAPGLPLSEVFPLW